MRPPFFIPKQVSSFHDYFKLTPESDMVANALGYAFEVAEVDMPRGVGPFSWTASLAQRLDTARLRVGITSETARREFLIAPILLEFALQYNVRLRVEFSLNVSEQLHGSLDYLVEAQTQLLVIEARDENISRGTTQLVAELAALDQWVEHDLPVLYGAISTGTIWQFLVLDRMRRKIIANVNTYRIPQDLVDLCAVLTGILNLAPTASEQEP